MQLNSINYSGGVMSTPEINLDDATFFDLEKIYHDNPEKLNMYNIISKYINNILSVMSKKSGVKSEKMQDSEYYITIEELDQFLLYISTYDNIPNVVSLQNFDYFKNISFILDEIRNNSNELAKKTVLILCSLFYMDTIHLKSKSRIDSAGLIRCRENRSFLIKSTSEYHDFIESLYQIYYQNEEGIIYLSMAGKDYFNAHVIPKIIKKACLDIKDVNVEINKLDDHIKSTIEEFNTTKADIKKILIL
jgi:hypothetical protein